MGLSETTFTMQSLISKNLPHNQAYHSERVVNECNVYNFFFFFLLLSSFFGRILKGLKQLMILSACGHVTPFHTRLTAVVPPWRGGWETEKNFRPLILCRSNLQTRNWKTVSRFLLQWLRTVKVGIVSAQSNLRLLCVWNRRMFQRLLLHCFPADFGFGFTHRLPNWPRCVGRGH